MSELEYLSTPSENADTSVIDHVGDVLVNVTDFGADRPIDFFEAFSYCLKEERQNEQEVAANPVSSMNDHLGPDFVKDSNARKMVESRLFPRGKLTAEGEEEEDEKEEKAGEEEEEKHTEEETQNEGEVPNVMGDMMILENAGVGLTEQETFMMQQAIQKLVRTKPLATTRFWGKVMGIKHSYYICEAEFNEGERPHAEATEEEEKGEEKPEGEENDDKIKEAPMEEDSGPNMYSYFVCTQLGAKWALLPDILPKQIVASRSIKHMFTGDLNAEVMAPPGRFLGTEKELLRCFIARVVHCCTIAPKGQYAPEEEPEEDQPLASNAPIAMGEEWEGKPIRDMAGFVHRVPCILPQGRTEFWAPEAEEEEKEPTPEIGVPILTPITEDEPLEGGIPSWSMRVLHVGAKQFWLRSNTWPGLNIVSSEKGDKIVMMYFGWGMKVSAPVEWPILPEPVKKVVPVEEEEEEEEEEKHETPEEEQDAESEAKPKKGADPQSEATYESGTYDSTYDS